MRTHSRETESPTVDDRPRLQTERIEACPLCGSAATKTWRTGCFDWQQPHAADRFEFNRCTGCGARFLGTRPLVSELGKVYFPGYGPYQAPATAASDLARTHSALRAAALPLRAAGAATGRLGRRRLSRMLDWAYTPEVEGDTLLDYGCGPPTFLDAAQHRGWNTIGADFAEGVVESVRARGHTAFLVGDDFERGIAEQSVACVRMNHVVEHLYEPLRVLERIRAKMRPGGRIHIATPNPGSAGSRVFRRYWWGLDCPRHVVLYRPRVLRNVLEQTGFRVLRIVHEGAAKDLARSWGIRLLAHERTEPSQIATMASDPVRLSLFGPAAVLTVMAAMADRYHVFAKT